MISLENEDSLNMKIIPSAINEDYYFGVISWWARENELFSLVVQCLLCNVLYIVILSLDFSGITTEKFDISPIRTFYRYYLLSFHILHLFAFPVFSVVPIQSSP